jgi:translation initiation factor 2 subunit 1
MKSKAVASIMRHVASKLPSVDGSADLPSADSTESKKSRRIRKEAEEEDVIVSPDDSGPSGQNEEEKLEQLYEQVAWPLGKIYGHPYDAFKLALTYAMVFFDALLKPIMVSIP